MEADVASAPPAVVPVRPASASEFEEASVPAEAVDDDPTMAAGVIDGARLPPADVATAPMNVFVAEPAARIVPAEHVADEPESDRVSEGDSVPAVAVAAAPVIG